MLKSVTFLFTAFLVIISGYITAITSLGFGGVLLIIVVMLAVFQFKLQKARSRPVMSTSSEPYPQTAKTR